MPNNDRVTNQSEIGVTWIGDSKTQGLPLVTKDPVGNVGWNADEKTRVLLTRDANNNPGWRDKIVTLPGYHYLEFDENLFRVDTQEPLEAILPGSDTPIMLPGLEDLPNGCYIKEMGNLGLYLLDKKKTDDRPYQYGCSVTLVNGTGIDKFFLKNFTTSQDQEGELVNFHAFQVVGPVTIQGVDKRRARYNVGCITSGKMTCTVKGTSWNPNLSEQTETGPMAASWVTGNLEFYEGDKVNWEFQPDSGYDWINFRRYVGDNINPGDKDFTLVPKSEVVYKDRGGTIDITMTKDILFLVMDVAKEISFYLYQPGSPSDNTYTNTKVKVASIPTNMTVYGDKAFPTVGTEVNFGRNGTKRSHISLYKGMRLSITTTTERRIAGIVSISYTDTKPSPSTPEKAVVADSPLYVTIGEVEDEEGHKSIIDPPNGMMAVGLRYIDKNYEIKYEFGADERKVDFNSFMDTYAWASVRGNSEFLSFVENNSLISTLENHTWYQGSGFSKCYGLSKTRESQWFYYVNTAWSGQWNGDTESGYFWQGSPGYMPTIYSGPIIIQPVVLIDSIGVDDSGSFFVKFVKINYANFSIDRPKGSWTDPSNSWAQGMTLSKEQMDEIYSSSDYFDNMPWLLQIEWTFYFYAVVCVGRA